MPNSPSVMACPRCGTEMEHSPAKPKGFAELAVFECPACGHKSTVDDLVAKARAVIDEVTNARNKS